MADNIPTTFKAVVNGITLTGGGNDPGVARKIFLDHRYVCPKLMAVLEEDLNVLAGRTFRKNWEGLPG